MNISDPIYHTCHIISTRVVVFPVPGGPCTTDTSFWFRADSTAFLWDLSRELLLKEGVGDPKRAFLIEEAKLRRGLSEDVSC